MDKGTSNTSASVLINAPASRDPRPQNQLPDSSRDADFRGLIPASFPLPGREYHLFGMATTRSCGSLDPGAFIVPNPARSPERDFEPASMSCSEHVNSRPLPNGPFSRNYLRHGDFATAIRAVVGMKG